MDSKIDPHPARRSPSCGFCDDTLVLTVAGYDLVCPTHPELHDSLGRARVSVEQASAAGVRRAEAVASMGAAAWVVIPAAAAMITAALWLLSVVVGAL